MYKLQKNIEKFAKFQYLVQKFFSHFELAVFQCQPQNFSCRKNFPLLNKVSVNWLVRM